MNRQADGGQTAADAIAGYYYPQGTNPQVIAAQLPAGYGQAVRKPLTVGDLKKQLENVSDDWTVSGSQNGYNDCLTLSPPVQDSVKILL